MTEPLRIERAVVTGPTGAVGLALIGELLDQGAEVVAVCRPDSSRIGQLPSDSRVSVVECALSDYAELSSLAGGEAQAFFHLAWDGTYGATRRDFTLQESNIRYSLDAVLAASEMGCGVFVGAGSQSEHGHVDGVLAPGMACHPDNGYGAAKLSACVMTGALCHELGMRHEWCRIVSMFGPGDGTHTLVSQVIDGLLKGEHVSCGPCEQLWDFIYSKDAARAFRLAAELGTDGAVYNVASGEMRPLREFVEEIESCIPGGGEVGFSERPYYPNQVMRLEADISNLVADTGFSPERSFEEGIRETIEWRRARL